MEALKQVYGDEWENALKMQQAKYGSIWGQLPWQVKKIIEEKFARNPPQEAPKPKRISPVFTPLPAKTPELGVKQAGAQPNSYYARGLGSEDPWVVGREFMDKILPPELQNRKGAVSDLGSRMIPGQRFQNQTRPVGYTEEQEKEIEEMYKGNKPLRVIYPDRLPPHPEAYPEGAFKEWEELWKLRHQEKPKPKRISPVFTPLPSKPPELGVKQPEEPFKKVDVGSEIIRMRKEEPEKAKLIEGESPPQSEEEPQTIEPEEVQVEREEPVFKRLKKHPEPPPKTEKQLTAEESIKIANILEDLAFKRWLEASDSDDENPKWPEGEPYANDPFFDPSQHTREEVLEDFKYWMNELDKRKFKLRRGTATEDDVDEAIAGMVDQYMLLSRINYYSGQPGYAPTYEQAYEVMKEKFFKVTRGLNKKQRKEQKKNQKLDKKTKELPILPKELEKNIIGLKGDERLKAVQDQYVAYQDTAEKVLRELHPGKKLTNKLLEKAVELAKKYNNDEDKMKEELSKKKK